MPEVQGLVGNFFSALKIVHDSDRMFFFSSRRRHTRLQGDWSSDVCSSDLTRLATGPSVVLGMAAKSVSWLLSTKPRVTWKEPMLDSTVVVMLSALPLASTIDRKSVV